MPKAPANGLELEYDTFGDPGAPPLVLIMGLGTQMIAWPVPFCQAIAEAGYHVIRYDNRDCGLSTIVDAPVPSFGDLLAGDTSRVPYLIPDLAADAAGLLDALSIDSAHIVGLSMGGMIAQQFALDHSSRVDSLTIADSVAANPPEARATWDQRAASARRDGMAPLAAATLERWLTEDFRVAHPEAVEPIHEALTRTLPEGYAMVCEALREFDVRGKLGAIHCPTLVVAGRHDTGTRPAASQEIADAIEGAHFELLDAAHLAPVEQSQRFAALLETFLERPV